jgi:hypothetical protein
LTVTANTNLHAQYNGSFVDIQPLPGLESPNSYVRFPNAISDDGLTMWLMHGANRSGAGVDIFKATRSSVMEPFNEVVPIDALNIGHANFAHEVSSDGLSTYFCSASASGRPKMWTATRDSSAGDWSVPHVFEIDGSDACRFPRLSHDQLTMYFRKNGVSAIERESVTSPFGQSATIVPRVLGASAVSTDELAIALDKTTGSPRDATQTTMLATRKTKDDPFGQPVNLDDFGLGSSFDRTWGYLGNAVLSANWPSDGSKLYFTAGKNAFFGQTLTIYEATWNVYADGDANLDDEVNFADFLILSENFGEAGAWRDGDFDGDGMVGFPDFLALSANFGEVGNASAASIPEPNAASIALLGLLAMIGFRKRR